MEGGAGGAAGRGVVVAAVVLGRGEGCCGTRAARCARRGARFAKLPPPPPPLFCRAAALPLPPPLSALWVSLHPRASTPPPCAPQVGPRACLNPIKMFAGSFGGPVIYENPGYVSPNTVRGVWCVVCVCVWCVCGGVCVCVCGRLCCRLLRLLGARRVQQLRHACAAACRGPRASPRRSRTPARTPSHEARCVPSPPAPAPLPRRSAPCSSGSSRASMCPKCRWAGGLLVAGVVWCVCGVVWCGVAGCGVALRMCMGATEARVRRQARVRSHASAGGRGQAAGCGGQASCVVRLPGAAWPAARWPGSPPLCRPPLAWRAPADLAPCCRCCCALPPPPMQSREGRKAHVAAHPLPRDELGDVFK